MTQIEIARTRHDDIEGILALQEDNQPERGGMLSARLPRAWFEAALDDLPIIVARRDQRVVGYLVSASRAAVAGVPVIAAMLRSYPGADDAYVYGPVCVAAEERGRGVAARCSPRRVPHCRDGRASCSSVPTMQRHFALIPQWECGR